MSKQNLFVLLLALLCVASVPSCKKETALKEKEEVVKSKPETGTSAQGQNKEGEFNVHDLALKLMSDRGFVSFMNDFTYTNYKIRTSIEPDSENPDGFVFLDEAQAEERREQQINAWALFADTNKDFFLLTKEEQIELVNYVREAWRSPEFREQNPDAIAPLNEMGIALAETLNSGGRTGMVSARITANELIGCALGALGSALGSYGDAIDDIRYIITQGWSGSALISAAASIIKNASPWWKVASVAIGFGACLWGVAD
jgi:hypothetical protein